jgi:hypothetical protein
MVETPPILPEPKPVTPPAVPDVPAPPAPEPENDRTLEENLFEDTIGVEVENDYKEDGYVVVRYFYNINCAPCQSPVDWDETLIDIAAEMDDVAIVELFDSTTKKWAKDRWAMAGLDVVADPVIRIEGMQNGQHAYKLYFGAQLSNMYDSPKEKLKTEICKFTEYC